MTELYARRSLREQRGTRVSGGRLFILFISRLGHSGVSGDPGGPGGTGRDPGDRPGTGGTGAPGGTGAAPGSAENTRSTLTTHILAHDWTIYNDEYHSHSCGHGMDIYIPKQQIISWPLRPRLLGQKSKRVFEKQQNDHLERSCARANQGR